MKRMPRGEVGGRRGGRHAHVESFSFSEPILKRAFDAADRKLRALFGFLIMRGICCSNVRCNEREKCRIARSANADNASIYAFKNDYVIRDSCSVLNKHTFDKLIELIARIL